MRSTIVITAVIVFALALTLDTAKGASVQTAPGLQAADDQAVTLAKDEVKENKDKPKKSKTKPNDDKDGDPDDGDAGSGNDDKEKPNDGPAND